MKNLNLLLSGVLVVSTVGCNCKPSGPTGLTPEFVATPTALSFRACPTKTDTGAPVADVFPDVKKLKIANQGKVAGDLKLSVSGAGASFFKLGEADGGVPSSIDRLGEIELPISFSPGAKGDVRADLTIDDNTEGTDDVLVTLTGEGINLPVQPKLETAPQKKDGTGFMLCTAETPLSDCTLEFPDTMMNQSNTLQLKIRNKGCPALKVTALNIDGQTPGTNDGFTLDSPARAPSDTSPLVLSTADGTDETTITIRFTAIDDNSGLSTQSHYAVLTILSNDPDVGDGFANPARIAIQANAVKPSIYVSPTSCNYTNAMDGCGNTPRVDHKASFRVTNDGSTPIQISGVRFRSSGTTTSSNNRFSVTQNLQGQTLQPAASGTVEVTEVDMPLLVSDQLEIVADIPGMAPGSGGTVVVSVISGIKPCLSTSPVDVVDFGDPAEEFTAKIVRISNGAGCGTLVINSVDVSQQPFYSLLDPKVAPGTQVAPGMSVEATVQYQRPSTGGQQLADLRIVTNDTDYGPPQYKLMLLQSNAAFDPFPTAQLSACAPAALINDPNCTLGASGSAAFNLSMIDPDEVTLSGAKSTDTAPGTVAEYRFTMLPPIPGGATTAALANNGQKITSNKTKLIIPPGVTGTFRVALEVWDNRGQQSPAPSTMTINIYP